MRWRVILGISVVANLVLAIGWLRVMRSAPVGDTDSPAGTNSITTTNVRTAVIVRRQFFSWQEVESRDYPTYIKNLREIGCPEQTIRDIIIADVTQVLREKYQAQAPQLRPNPKWWTNFRDPGSDATESPQMNDLWAERSVILTQLLGPDWAVRSTNPIPQTNSFQALVLATLEVNPLLRGLGADKKQQVAAVLSGATAEPASDLEWNGTRIVAEEKARWAKLGEILALDQLEALKLHFSSQAERLRNELDALPGFNTQPEEFRKMFRATEPIDEQIALLSEGDDPGADPRLDALLLERNKVIRAALAPQRYELYVRLQDPAYLSALDSLANGGDPQALATLYAINREATAEQERILNNESLTEKQREIELKRLELEQLKATAEALGEKLPEEPGQKEAPPKTEPMKAHAVLSGEGLDRIARLYGMSPEAIKAANPTVNFNQLRPGTTLNVPLRMIYPLPPPPAE